MILRGGVRSVMTVDVLCDGHRVYRAPTRSLLLMHTHKHTHWTDKNLCTLTGEAVMWTDEEISQPDKTARQTE